MSQLSPKMKAQAKRLNTKWRPTLRKMMALKRDESRAKKDVSRFIGRLILAGWNYRDAARASGTHTKVAFDVAWGAADQRRKRTKKTGKLAP